MTIESSPARELGLFLRSRREQTTPAQLGLEPGGRRRVAGLRREEVAALASLSTDYYQRLEQGRNAHPSDAILDSIADALDLDDVERSHLMRLAQAARNPPATPRRRPARVPRNARALLDATEPGTRLPPNSLATPKNCRPRNETCCSPSFKTRLSCASPTAAPWRSNTSGCSDPPSFETPSIPAPSPSSGHCPVRSAEFRILWARHDVRDRVEGGKTIRHPRVGDIDVEWDAYSLAGGATMIVMTPRPGHEDRLRLLSLLTPARSAVTPPTVASATERK